MDIEDQKLQNLAYEAINGLPEEALRDALRYFIDVEFRTHKEHNAIEDRSRHLQMYLAAYHEGYREARQFTKQLERDISITV